MCCIKYLTYQQHAGCSTRQQTSMQKRSTPYEIILSAALNEHERHAPGWNYPAPHKAASIKALLSCLPDGCQVGSRPFKARLLSQVVVYPVFRADLQKLPTCVQDCFAVAYCCNRQQPICDDNHGKSAPCSTVMDTAWLPGMTTATSCLFSAMGSCISCHRLCLPCLQPAQAGLRPPT